MATIMKDTKQLQALNEIEEAIATVKAINTIELGSGIMNIVFTPEESKNAIKIALSSSEEEKIKSVLKSKKIKLSKEILNKAEKFRITLSDEEKKTIK